MSSDCVFCATVADSPSVTVAEDETTLSFININPASDGQLLVIPKRHSVDLLDIPADDLAAFTRVAQRIAEVGVTELGTDGVNLLNCGGSRRAPVGVPLPRARDPAVRRRVLGMSDCVVPLRAKERGRSVESVSAGSRARGSGLVGCRRGSTNGVW